MERLLESLGLWLDPVARSGPENMAVDEWLLETVSSPILRVYRWCSGWVSLGCFCSLNQAIDGFPGRRYVRRPSGGGIVDHQYDWTYSLVISKDEKLYRERASESYRLVHQILSSVLSDRFKLYSPASSVGELGGVCFEKPVESDVLNIEGNKVAGAGQRRTKDGLLHQGSVFGEINNNVSNDRSKRFASALCDRWEMVEVDPPAEVIRAKVDSKYGSETWTYRR
jgi:lipoate-protein ligase A